MLDDAPALPSTFTVADGRAAGLAGHDLRSSALGRPFHGVRTVDEIEEVEDRARAYAVKMHPQAWFSHTTAAVLHDMWLPSALNRDRVLHVARPPGVRAPRDRMVKGHTLIERPGHIRERRGLRVASPREAFCQLATILGLLDLIVAGETLLARGRPHPLELHMLVSAVDAGARPRQALLERVLPALRPGVRSPQETKLRLLLLEAGFEEPEINAHVLAADGTDLGECDLVFRRARVVVEYEGVLHFRSEEQQRKDVLKYERLQDAGWRVVRVTKDDLAFRRDELIHRLRRALVRAA